MNMLDKLLIQWDTKKKAIDHGYTIDGSHISNGVATGIALTPGMVWANKYFLISIIFIES